MPTSENFRRALALLTFRTISGELWKVVEMAEALLSFKNVGIKASEFLNFEKCKESASSDV